ncbi:MAG: hypothetical protein K2H49_09135 [Muribaculaceae bacterium]|nr:hypothetical protein [Muribaculaceae bacterium]
MMKKVLYGVALAFVSLMTMGSLQSCKDDWSDLATQTKYDVADLQYQIERQKNALEDSIRKHREELNKLLPILNDYATVTYVDTTLQKAKDALAKSDTVMFDTLANRINGALGRIKTLDDKITGIDTINKNRYLELQGQVAAQKASIDTIKNRLTAVEGLAERDSLRLDTLEESVKDLWEDIFGDQPGSLVNNIAQIARKVEDVENAINSFVNRFDLLVTSIVVQGTDCPVFGNFSLPIGVQSNLLFNWYGYSANEDFAFPSYDPDVNYYDTDNAPVAFTQADFARLKPTTETIKRGYLGDVNLGKLYLTVNPVGHMFDDESFVLQSSAENNFPATLKVKKSTDEIFFGYSRAQIENTGNGFYEANVVVEEKDIPAARLDIDASLKSAAKDALENPSKRNAVELLKAVYNQMNGKLPAYAVRYDWTATDSVNGEKDYSVLSKYEVAATTVKPLSYSFLYGKGSSKKLPTIGALDNFIAKLKDNENLKFNFSSNIQFDNVNLSIGTIEVGTINGNLTIKIPSIDVKDPEGNVIGSSQTTIIPSDSISGFDSLAKQIADSIGTGVNRAMEKLNTQINNDILGQVKSQVNKLISDMNSQINGKITNFFTDLENQADPYFERLNKVIDLYNKVAGKINKFLADPNQYLQVAMFYNQAGGGVGVLSNNFNDPIHFKLGNGKIALYASSYTGEIVAPAYKKYVACSMVYDKNRNKLEGEVEAVNNSYDRLNKVMSGATIVYELPASALKANRIYEIVYQGVDYSGRTSTQKFYIQVD